MEQTYFTIYKITNLLNGKIYIGSHKTKKLDDNYMGSGKYLKRAQEKDGLENFTKEILFVFDNPEEMYAKEAELVNEEFLVEENTYNLKVGGFGGWDYCNKIPRSNEHMKNMSLAAREKYPNGTGFGLPRSQETKNKISSSLKGSQNFLGKKHTEEFRIMIKNHNSIAQSGEGNSQFGTMWITNGTESKKIKKTDIIPENWRRGRKQSAHNPREKIAV